MRFLGTRYLLASIILLIMTTGLLSGFDRPVTGRLALPLPQIDPQAAEIRLAVIGDYGSGDKNEAAVANLVKSWNPDFIITVGDNNYPAGLASTIDRNIGQFYHDFIYPYQGSYGTGAAVNRFFPTVGNNDWNTPGAEPYFNYFTLPGNERYYDFTWGPLHLFALHSDSHEPDGISMNSIQAAWLQQKLAASISCWNLVYFHHPPFSSSSNHGSNRTLQWPFQAWGADVVLAGHDHTYERIMKNGFPYFVNGLGGNGQYDFGKPVAGSQVRYNSNYGAMLITASQATITYQFINIDNIIIDTYSPPGSCSEGSNRLYLPLILRRS